jgi:nicotinamide-nucleotide amidase
VTAPAGGLAALLGLDPALVTGTVAALRARSWTVAAAESLTAGLLTAVLTEVPGASAVVRGGLVVYATDLKHSLAGVDRHLLDRVGAVHPQVAEELAAGVRSRCGATIGVGLTGVAGPDPQDGIAVGTWFCALSGPTGTPSSVHGSPVQVPSGSATAVRAAVRAAAVTGALELLHRVATG